MVNSINEQITENIKIQGVEGPEPEAVKHPLTTLTIILIRPYEMVTDFSDKYNWSVRSDFLISNPYPRYQANSCFCFV